MSKATVFSLVLIAILLTSHSGCQHRQLFQSGLEVKKVPSDCRLSGNDYHYKGFRYYLSRPYVTVTRRLEVARNYEICELVETKAGNPKLYYLRTLRESSDAHEENYNLYYSLDGMPVAENDPLYSSSASEIRVVSSVAFTLQDDELEELQDSVSDLDDRLEQAEGKIGTLDRDVVALKEAAAGDAIATPAPAGKIEVNIHEKESKKSGGAVLSAIQVAYLPDFEEQMAIEHKNRLAYGKLALNFEDGWRLSSTQGSFNSTEVPVKIAQTISSAIEAAAEIASSALKTLPVSPTRGVLDLKELHKGRTLVLISTTQFIEPGIYRIQKPSEMRNTADMGQPFLTELGLPISSDTQVQLIDSSN